MSKPKEIPMEPPATGYVLALEDIINMNAQDNRWIVLAPDGRLWGDLSLDDILALVAKVKEDPPLTTAQVELRNMPAMGNG